jgi:hypothetical protein
MYSSGATSPDGGRDDGPQARRRVVWTDETATCTVCGDEFPLDEPHYLLESGDDDVLACSRGCRKEIDVG